MKETFKKSDRTTGIATTRRCLSISIPKYWDTRMITKVIIIPDIPEPTAK